MNQDTTLHSTLTYHIANTLGWSGLREVQQASIAPILGGDNVVILAPTAGGKTEAAFFPLLSQMLTHNWQGLSVIYLSPIKALLNNQHERLMMLAGMIGHEAQVWHGDVNQTQRKKIRKQPPSILLTTPESLEAMLISKSVDAHAMFHQLQAIVIDEVHAFAGADRGWHLLGVLSRISHYAKRDIQRIGLSATVGNKNDIVHWLSKGSERGTCTVDPVRRGSSHGLPEVKLDWVSTLSNAAQIIAKLHANKKRLVFCDSRIQAEKLTRELRARQVTTHITHSSLSAGERRRTEDSFREGGAGVIVATSALELGIDIGELDYVMTIDSPMSVASFLQRMGRTGRRAGTSPNMLFLGVSTPGFIRAAAILELWKEGYVEDVNPPAYPIHILAQQIMAVILESPGIPGGVLYDRLEGFLSAAEISQEDFLSLVRHMHQEEYLFNDGGLIGVGRKGEEELGHRHFMELVSVFTTPPVFKVMHNRRELGEVDQSTFYKSNTENTERELPVILLAGRSWIVNSISWSTRVVYVEPFDMAGTTRWPGSTPDMTERLARAHQKVLVGEDLLAQECWSSRAHTMMDEIWLGYQFLQEDAATWTPTSTTTEFWTFRGTSINRRLAALCTESGYDEPSISPLLLEFRSLFEESSYKEIDHLYTNVDTMTVNDIEMLPSDHKSAQSLKFNQLIPENLLRKALTLRWYDL